MIYDYFDTYAKEYKPYKMGAWCYEDGLIYRGLELLHRSTKDPIWLNHIVRLITPQIEAGSELRGYDASDYNIDNIQPGKALLYLYEQMQDQIYLSAAERLGEQLRAHPRTQSGVFWHKQRYPSQVWLDGLYMGLPFQIELGLRTGRGDLLDDALTQLNAALKMTFVEKTRLYSHAVDEAKMQKWADPQTGHSSAHWARAVGWLSMALVDIAELVGSDRFSPFRTRTMELLRRIAELRREDGLWFQVIDQPKLFGNFEESSASAMFAYALVKSRGLRLWSGETDSLIQTLFANVISDKVGGGKEMINICHVAGLGMYNNRFRDGSAKYYLSEVCVSDDPKGVGPLMMLGAIIGDR